LQIHAESFSESDGEPIARDGAEPVTRDGTQPIADRLADSANGVNRKRGDRVKGTA
jgi:hypothetical protein